MDDYFTGYLWAQKALSRCSDPLEVLELIELDRVAGKFVEFNNGAEMACKDFQKGCI